MSDPVVSILIVTWKRIDLLEECLHGIVAAKTDVPFEIVIVNNGGARTAARVDAISAGARVVHSRVNLGFPGGLNSSHGADYIHIHCAKARSPRRISIHQG